MDPTTHALMMGSASGGGNTYLAVGGSGGGGNGDRVNIYKESNGTFTKLATPASIPTSGIVGGISFDKTGTYLAVGGTVAPRLTMFKRSGDTFTKVADPASDVTSNTTAVDFSDDSNFVAVSNSNPSGTESFAIYSRSGDVLTKLSSITPSPTGYTYGWGSDIDFSNDGVYLALTTWAAPDPPIVIHKRSGSTFTKLTNPAYFSGIPAYGCAFSNTGTYLAVANGAVPYLLVYKRSGDVFTRLTTPTQSQPTSDPNRLIFSPYYDDWLVVAGDSFLHIYSVFNDNFTKYLDPLEVPSGMVNGLAFSADGSYLAVAHDNPPYLSIYSVVADSRPLVKLPNPTVLPPGSAECVSFLTLE
jgi:WD40 repeat protein